MNEVNFSDIQDRLSASGVQDVKFFFKSEAYAQPISEVKKSVMTVLDAYLSGKHQAMGTIGDSQFAYS
jgi:hypothetical protein